MEQTRALNALEQFLVLSKSAPTASATADIIVQATSASNTYCFAELLQQPRIQALRKSPDRAGHLRLLEIFAWGLWSDYESNAALLPPLNVQQQQKLRLLTLLSLAAANSPTSSTLTYAHLTAALALPSTRALESLLTTAIYASLITATLDPAHGVAVILSVAPVRDLAPGSAPALAQQLELWGTRCEAALAELDARIDAVKADAKVRKERERRVDSVLSLEKEELEKDEGEEDGPGGRRSKKRGFKGKMEGFFSGHGVGGHDGADDAMDVDTGGPGNPLRTAAGQKRRGR